MMTFQYKFNDFCFKNGYLLAGDLREISLAPKESAVLHFMLERANSVISKEAFISHVWKGGSVSDESITRCIYVLRRALGQTNANRFIETVYGKGYRFIPRVEMVEEPEILAGSDIDSVSDLRERCSVALFPFEMKAHNMSSSLHDKLIDWLCCLKVVNSPPINVVSSFFTRGFQDHSGFLSAIEKLQADFYISGVEVCYGEKSIMRIELVRADDHSVLHREGVQLTDDLYVDYRALCRAMLSLLANIRPDIERESPALNNIEAELTQPIQDDVQHFSISALKKYMLMVQGRAINSSNSISELCGIAGAYYAIANLGLMDYENVRNEITIIADRIISSEPNNAIALSLQGLLSCDEDKKEAESNFHLAMLLSPSMAEVYYYYACYLVRQGDVSKALQMNNISLELNDSFFSPKILNVIIQYLKGNIRGAVEYGEHVLDVSSPGNTVMSGLLALIYARLGELRKARTFAKQIRKHKRSCEFMSYCYNEVAGIAHDDKGGLKSKFMSTISLSKKKGCDFLSLESLMLQ